MATKPGNNWRCPTCRQWVRCEMAKRCTKCAQYTIPTVGAEEFRKALAAVARPEPEPEPVDPYAPTWTRVPEPEDLAA